MLDARSTSLFLVGFGGWDIVIRGREERRGPFHLRRRTSWSSQWPAASLLDVMVHGHS